MYNKTHVWFPWHFISSTTTTSSHSCITLRVLHDHGQLPCICVHYSTCPPRPQPAPMRARLYMSSMTTATVEPLYIMDRLGMGPLSLVERLSPSRSCHCTTKHTIIGGNKELHFCEGIPNQGLIWRGNV